MLRKLSLESKGLRAQIIRLKEREELDRRERIESDRAAQEGVNRYTRDQRRSDAITSPSMVVLNI